MLPIGSTALTALLVSQAGRQLAVDLPTSYSLVFFAAFVSYLLLGLFVLAGNSRSRLNQVFFLLCFSLGLWSLAFSLANAAPDYATALLWRRVSAVGWGSMYSLLLHFILLLTADPTESRGRGWRRWWLYLPAAVCVYVFALHPALVAGQYNLVRTAAGWANLSVNNHFDWFFNVYYAGYTGAGVYLLWRWGRRTHKSWERQQARALVWSFGVALLLGTLTDVVNSSYPLLALPQVGPLVILIPIAAIFFAMRRYRLLRPAGHNQPAESGRILNSVSRQRLYGYISLAHVLGSIGNFAGGYFVRQQPLGEVAQFSLILLTVGAGLYWLQRLPLSADKQDLVATTILALSIPLLSLRFPPEVGVSVWPVTITFLLFAVLFRSRLPLIIFSVSSLFSQLLAWWLHPTLLVAIEPAHYQGRLFVLAVVIWLAFYVNGVYAKRLQENERQIRTQQLVAAVSADFLTINADNLEAKLQQLLAQSGAALQVDHCCCCRLGAEPELGGSWQTWSSAAQPTGSLLAELPAERLSWLLAKMEQRQTLELWPSANLSEAAAALLADSGLQALLVLPVFSNSRLFGLLALGSRQVGRALAEEQEVAAVLANLLADALAKVETLQEINFLAYYDALTALPNRTLFHDRLNQAIHLARRSEKLIMVMFLDLDDFKAVNDSLGHSAGDELLVNVAKRLSARVRRYDTVARFGGDEFLIMLPQVAKMEDVEQIAAHVMETLAQPIAIADQEFFVSASAGVAVFPADGEDAETLVKHADMAMYAAKESGKNRFALCTPLMKEDVLRKMQLTNSLYRAVERNELVLHYQPQVAASDQQVIGLEALVRWQHPTLGLVPPGVFIPLAEQAGLINQIGEWVLRTACQQNCDWQKMGLPPVRVAVNLSVEQFRKPGLVAMVRRVLQETGLNPAYLELEITESTATKEADYIVPILTELKALGVTISIDDFGTEYSSLSRLKLLPIDRVKIAMQFVHGIAISKKDEAIAKVIVNLARNLGLRVIAEGVETSVQLAFLQGLMCDEIQGYYFFRPLPAERAAAVLASRLGLARADTES